MNNSSITNSFSGNLSSIEAAYLGNEFKANTINIGVHESSEKRKAGIAKALVYPDIDSRKGSILPPAWKSFDWIWETGFTEWLLKTKNVFWITGKPGSGKSTLVKYLVEHYRVRELLASDGKDWCIVHFFFDYNFAEDTANNAEGLLRSLLIQLVRESATTADALKQALAGNTIPASEQQLFDALNSILRHHPERFCIFVDGLDEYRGQLPQLLNMLLRLQQQANVAMCIASRDIAAIRTKLDGYQSIVMHHHNLESIRTFLNTANEDLVTELRTPCPNTVLLALADRADGVILWARFAFERLLENLDENHSSESELLASIQHLPVEMGTMYAQALERIPSKFRTEAAFYLNHMTTTQSGLTTGEVYEIAKFLTLRHPDKFQVPTRLSSKQFSQRLYALLGGLISIKERNAIEYVADSMAANRCIQASRQGAEGFVSVCTIHPIHETLHVYLQSSEWVRSRLDWLISEKDLRLSRMELYVSVTEHVSKNPSTTFEIFFRVLSRWMENKSLNKLTEEEKVIVGEHCFAFIAPIRILNELDRHENMLSQAGPDALKLRLRKIGSAFPNHQYHMDAKFPLLRVLLRGLASPLVLCSLPFLHIDTEWYLGQYLSCGFLAWALLLPSPETLIVAFQSKALFSEELKRAMLATAMRKIISQRYRSTAHDNACVALILVTQFINALPHDEHWMAMYETKNPVERALSNLREAFDTYGWQKLHSTIESEHQCNSVGCQGSSFLYHIATDSFVGIKSFPLVPEKNFHTILRKVQRVKLLLSLYKSASGLQRPCYADGSFIHAVFYVQQYSYRFSGELLLKVLFAIRNGVCIRTCRGIEPLHGTLWRLAWTTRKLLETTNSSLRVFQAGDRLAYYQEIEALLKLFDYNDLLHDPQHFGHVQVPETLLEDCENLRLRLLRQCRSRDWELLWAMNIDIPPCPLPPSLLDLDRHVEEFNVWMNRVSKDDNDMESAESLNERAKALVALLDLDVGFGLGRLTVPAKTSLTVVLAGDDAFQGFTFSDELTLEHDSLEQPPLDDDGKADRPDRPETLHDILRDLSKSKEITPTVSERGSPDREYPGDEAW